MYAFRRESEVLCPPGIMYYAFEATIAFAPFPQAYLDILHVIGIGLSNLPT
jgi:hypothetical protein